MNSKLEGTVNYFQFVNCTLNAVKQNRRGTSPETKYNKLEVFTKDMNNGSRYMCSHNTHVDYQFEWQCDINVPRGIVMAKMPSMLF